MLATFAKGILIGVLVSAPMGPTGILCVKRTMHQGRKEGLLTGVGATLSDLIYAAITFLFIGMLIHFLESNDALLKLIGSIIMFFFGIYLIKSTPRDVMDNTSSGSPWRTIISAFLFTLSNFSILGFYIALFSRFNLISESEGLSFLTFLAAMLGIASGALLWWTCITYLVSLMRERFRQGSLRSFIYIIASIFILISLVGIFDAIWQYL